jgi:hypothetical protein
MGMGVVVVGAWASQPPLLALTRRQEVRGPAALGAGPDTAPPLRCPRVWLVGGACWSPQARHRRRGWHRAVEVLKLGVSASAKGPWMTPAQHC